MGTGWLVLRGVVCGWGMQSLSLVMLDRKPSLNESPLGLHLL